MIHQVFAGPVNEQQVPRRSREVNLGLFGRWTLYLVPARLIVWAILAGAVTGCSRATAGGLAMLLFCADSTFCGVIFVLTTKRCEPEA